MDQKPQVTGSTFQSLSKSFWIKPLTATGSKPDARHDTSQAFLKGNVPWN